MAGSFKTGADELQRAGTQMEDTNSQLMSNLSKLASECEQIRGTWQGAAAIAFTNLMSRFEEDAKNLNNSLQQISEAIGANATNYRQQEQEAQQSMSSITNTLGG
ncbi:MAG TPA: WXG100 family type VII secretion target [Pseudonocardiaceae bacterium]